MNEKFVVNLTFADQVFEPKLISYLDLFEERMVLNVVVNEKVFISVVRNFKFC